VLVLRYREPERPRSFKAPLGPLFPILSIIFCIVLMMGLEVMTWLAFFLWLTIGLMIYFLYSRHRSEFAKQR
jgi:APA family basic amino acid/polyamine antiporter